MLIHFYAGYDEFYFLLYLLCLYPNRAILYFNMYMDVKLYNYRMYIYPN